MSSDRYAIRRSARQGRARDTIDTILEAASRLVASAGIDSLNTNRIAELAGVSIGSLYQYFPGKDAVLHALLEREFTRSVEAVITFVESLDPAVTPLEEAVVQLVDRVFDEHLRKIGLYRGLLSTALSFHRLRFTLDNDVRTLATFRRKIVQYLGPVDERELDRSTFVLLHALKGVQLGAAFSHRPTDDDMRRLIVRVVLAALPAPPR